MLRVRHCLRIVYTVSSNLALIMLHTKQGNFRNVVRGGSKTTGVFSHRVKGTPDNDTSSGKIVMNK